MPPPIRSAPPCPWRALAIVAVLLLVTAACGSTSPSAADAGTATATADPGGSSVPSPGCRADGATATTGSATRVGQLTTASGTRSYRLTLPATYDPSTPTPMILAFHGYGSDAATFSTITGYPDEAAAAGFVMVVPDGVGRTWQFDGHGSDAQFVDALIDDIERSFCIDERRIAASGFSAGAAFTIAYACAHLDRISAIATVSVDFLIGCTTPLSILAFHGTADPMVPYQDGAEGQSLPGVKVRGTELTMTDWAKLDGCETEPILDRIGTEVVRHTYPGCQDDTEVVLYEVQRGGHSWPGADPSVSGGLTTQQIDATEEAVAFFGRHARS